MTKIKLFVEGEADKKFLSDYLFFLKGTKLTDADFVIIGSNNEESIKKRKNEFASNTDNGGINLLIFDADLNFSSTSSNLEIIKNSIGINYDFFLFPNNKDNGQLEHLLLEIIPSENKTFFDCFDSFERCLERDERFSLPVLKSKIFAYVDSLLSKTEKKSRGKFAEEKNRDYTDVRFWNLENASLYPLKDFLNIYF